MVQNDDNFLQQVKALAVEAELISFDFFDTLFVRTVLDPEDVFDIVGQKVGLSNFRALRKQAQQLAFQRMRRDGKREICYSDIYESFPSCDVDIEHLKETELDVERAVLHPNDELMDLFHHLISEKKRVVITSDMYLPRSFFNELLQAHGLPEVPVFASSDANATKRDYGELFDHIAAEFDVVPANILHIGDNATSDVQRAKERGLRALLYRERRKPRKMNLASLEHSIGSSLMRKHHGQFAEGSFGEFGFHYGGPAALGTLDWLRERFVQDELDLILFLSRDGYILSKTAEIVWPETTPSHRYFLGSRTAFTLAAMCNENFLDFLPFLLSGSRGLSAYELLERIDVPAPSERVMRDIGLSDDQFIDESNRTLVEEFLYAYRSEILKIATRNRRALFNYLSNLGLRPGMRVGLFDVGWNGTTQEAFERAVKPIFDLDVHGYYLSLANTPERRAREKALQMQSLVDESCYSSNSLDALYKNRVGAELVFSAPHPSVIGWNLERDGQVTPRADPRRLSDIEGSKHLAKAANEICEGVLAYCESFKSIRERLSLVTDPREKLRPFVEHVGSGRWRDEPVIASLTNFDDWGMSLNDRTSLRSQ